jgi:hypothetical protein
MTHTETVISWTRSRRLHVMGPPVGLSGPELTAVRHVVARLDDLDRVADALARIVGRPVRVRAWQPPTSDFFLEIQTLG